MASPKANRDTFAEQQDALNRYLQDLLTETESAKDDDSVETRNIGWQSGLDNVQPSSTETLFNTAAGQAPEINSDLSPEPPLLESFVCKDEAVLSPILDISQKDTDQADNAGRNNNVLPLQTVLFPQSFLEPSDTFKKRDAKLETGSRNEADSLEADKRQEQQPEVIIPEWAKSRFQCLSFSVTGFSIATPLEKLNGIIEWPEHVTVIPGHSEWFLGLYRNRGQNVQIIDLAAILAGDRGLAYSPSLRNGGEQGLPRYIMLVDEGRMGFASDSVANMLTLEPEQVKWRTTAQQRPLVLGTVIDAMCSIVDIDALVDHINQR